MRSEYSPSHRNLRCNKCEFCEWRDVMSGGEELTDHPREAPSDTNIGLTKHKARTFVTMTGFRFIELSWQFALIKSPLCLDFLLIASSWRDVGYDTHIRRESWRRLYNETEDDGALLVSSRYQVITVSIEVRSQFFPNMFLKLYSHLDERLKEAILKRNPKRGDPVQNFLQMFSKWFMKWAWPSLIITPFYTNKGTLNVSKRLTSKKWGHPYPLSNLCQGGNIWFRIFS